MWKFVDFIERHKFGIIIAFASFIGLYIYFQMETYVETFDIPGWGTESRLEKQEIEIKPENIETIPQDVSGGGEVKSISKDLNDKRKTSDENWDKNKSSKSAEQSIKDLEKQYYAQTGESQKRDEIRKQLEAAKNSQKTDNSSSKSKNEQNSQGGNTGYKGKTMISWELKSREPHQGNEWYIRNPGYTCGYGSNGEVYIKIKVNQNGNVISAIYVPELSSNASSCMIEQAKKYALMSRFSYGTSTANQEGKIIYTFIAQ